MIELVFRVVGDDVPVSELTKALQFSDEPKRDGDLLRYSPSAELEYDDVAERAQRTIDEHGWGGSFRIVKSTQT